MLHNIWYIQQNPTWRMACAANLLKSTKLLYLVLESACPGSVRTQTRKLDLVPTLRPPSGMYSKKM